jgi:hypothetical protein
VCNENKIPKACVRTYGCQQNVADSERIKGMLATMGYEFTEFTEEADLVYLSAVPGPLPPAHLIDLMAARKALLAVQCPAFNTLLNTSNAMLVPYAAPAIAQALLQHLQMPTLCADHAQAAYTTIHAENNAKAVVEEVRRCYELALEGGITQ